MPILVQTILTDSSFRKLTSSYMAEPRMLSATTTVKKRTKSAWLPWEHHWSTAHDVKLTWTRDREDGTEIGLAFVVPDSRQFVSCIVNSSSLLVIYTKERYTKSNSFLLCLVFGITILYETLECKVKQKNEWFRRKHERGRSRMAPIDDRRRRR